MEKYYESSKTPAVSYFILITNSTYFRYAHVINTGLFEAAEWSVCSNARLVGECSTRKYVTRAKEVYRRHELDSVSHHALFSCLCGARKSVLEQFVVVGIYWDDCSATVATCISAAICRESS